MTPSTSSRAPTVTGFETDTSGWRPTGKRVVLSRVSGGHSGSFAAKLANTGTARATCTLDDSPNWVSSTSSGTYTGSLWVRADTAGAKLALKLREKVGTTVLLTRSKAVTLSTSWQQVTVTLVPTQPGTSTLDYTAAVAKAPVGTCFYADDASITRR